MARSVRLIDEAPNVENTIPAALYKSYSPERFSIEDDDKFVLYGGGSNFRLTILDNNPSQSIILTPELQNIQDHPLSLFALNTSLVLWFDDLKVGLEITYQSIILHALLSTNEPSIYLQILSNDLMKCILNSDFELSVEATITMSPENRTSSNRLFDHVQQNLVDVYHAISECSALNVDSDEEDEDEDTIPALQVPDSWVEDQNISLQNTGNADDLEMDEPPYSPNTVAGMNVDVGYASLLGSIRKREDDNESISKARRLQ